MKFLPSALLALALISAPIDFAAAQSGSQTFPAQGSMDGHQLVSVTFNFDTQSITYHYADGGHFTAPVSNFALFMQAYKMYSQRDLDGN